MSDSLLDGLAQEVAALVAPLTRTVRHPDELRGLLSEIGSFAADDPALVSTLQSIANLTTQLETLATQSEYSFDDIQALLDVAQRTFALISTLTTTGTPSDPLRGLGRDLIDLLVMRWLLANHPTTRDVAVLLGLIEPAEEQAPRLAEIANDTLMRAPFHVDRMRFDRIGGVLRDPLAALRAEYGNSLATDADAAAVADKLFPRIVRLLRNLGVNCRYGINPNDAALLGNSAPLLQRGLIVYAAGLLDTAQAEAGVILMLSPTSRGNLGLVITPFGSLALTKEIGGWTVAARASADVAVAAWGPQGITVLSDTHAAEATGSITGTLAAPDDGPAYVLGAADGTRLEIGGARLALETSLSEARRTFGLSADVLKSSLVIAPGDSDGFLADILPADGLRADFDLGIAWANDTGLTLRGSGSLDATVPVRLALGPVTLSAVHLRLLAQATRALVLETSVSMNASIGPVHAAVTRVGLTATTTFPESGGNLGVADIALGFKSPDGVGLSVDAHGVLTGGGFLMRDHATGTYGGVLQLSLHDEITLTAFGLISTRMPDGSRGYSLLVFITAEGFKPVQLGFGFQLTSIGGMLGIHRTFDEEVLKAGLKTDALSTLLFPRDPVANAPAILQTLAAAFPVKRGSYLLGLLARITWLTPTVVQADLALILELGSRTRLLVLGRVSALLPSRDNDLIRLNLDSIGVLDFDEGTLAAEAVLVDSRLVHQFPVTGSAALRARWSGDPSFVLAVGGLNPRFAAPAGFPTLERVTIALCAGKNPRLICDSYLAITPNTVQFGAHASLYAEALGFSVAGDLGFDALITILPPHFLIDFQASVQLKRGSHNLFKITLKGTLEGPLPLRIAARAKFEIFWFSFTVPFEFTLASGRGMPSLPPVSVVTELTKAIADPTNWTTRRAPAIAQGVSLRPVTAGTSPVLDPLGQLVLQQQVVPLNATRDIDTFGGSPVDGPRRFTISAALNGRTGAMVPGSFAPARYFAMSDDDKLSSPSFETMDAGFVVGDETASYDAAAIVPASVDYDATTLQPTWATTAALSFATVGAGATSMAMPLAAAAAAAPAPQRYTMPLEALQKHLPTGAAARVPARRVGRARFRNANAAPAATVRPTRWRIMRIDDEVVAPIDPGITTWSEYRDELARLNRGGARWRMVPEHEVASFRER
jgi:hypothetical protein